MNTLVENFLWRFRRPLTVAALLCAVVAMAVIHGIYSLCQHRSAQAALQAAESRKMADERLQVETSNHVAVAMANQAQAESEKNRRLAVAQQLELQKQADLKQEEELRRARAEAAAKFESYRARYINTSFTRNPASKTFAVAAASENNTMNPAIQAALASRLRKEPVEIVSSYFKGPFVADGMFEEAFDGTGDPFGKLGLSNSLDGVILGKQTVEFTGDASLDNLVSAKMQLQIEVLPISGRADSKGWTFTSYGPGFSKDVARQAAEQRIIDQIAKDTNMTLTAVSDTH